MKIFDCHCHIEKGLERYDLEGVEARNVIFNTIEDYKRHRNNVPKGDAVSLIFDYKNNLNFVLNEINLGNIQALKIHSREQKLEENDYPVLIENLKNADNRIPIIIDAFYYDHHLIYQMSLSTIIKIATEFSDRKIVVAHSGGHKILDYFFHLRTLKNVYYDLSFSLQYLSDSSCYQDIIKLVKYTDKTKILFGSDFSWASPKFQFEELQVIFQKLNFSEEDKELIFYYNSFNLFNNKKIT